MLFRTCFGVSLVLGAAACSTSSAQGTDAGTTSPPPSADAGGADAAIDAGSGDADAPLPVGVTTRTFVDMSRSTPANGTAAAQSSRTLVTEIWYPTTDPNGLTSPVRDAALAPGGPYPLVFFVHGSSSGRLLSTYLTTALAAEGYVVAAADFPLTALSTAGGPSDLHVTDEVGDLSFLCDQLKSASTTASDALHGAVDGLGYAVVGHSTGGAVAELAAFAGDDSQVTHDPRVRAVVPLSGDACMFDASFFKSRTVPVFAIGGSNDLFVRFANSGAWVYANTNAPHLLADLVGGQHMGFTDLGLDDALLGPVPTGPTSPLAQTLSAYGDAGACLPVPSPGTDPMLTLDAQHALVIQLVSAFLDAELRGNSAALNAVESAPPASVVLQH